MLSKFSGQILRVSTSMHVFNIETGGNLPDTISDKAIEAAINFVKVCYQHTAYITGRGNLDKHLGILDARKHYHKYDSNSIIATSPSKYFLIKLFTGS